MLIVSHRGRGPQHHENTLEAFSWALQTGVDGIETDLRLTRDGHVVLYHDRLAPDGQRVSRLSWAELEHQTGYAVPTLEQALELAPDCWWLLELKSPDMNDAVEAALRVFPALPHITLISFWHEPIAELARRLPVEFGYTVSHGPSARAAAAFGDLVVSDQLPIQFAIWNFEFLSRSTVAALHDRGLRCIAFNADTEADFEDCLDWNVAAVITDFPQTALSLRQTRLLHEPTLPDPGSSDWVTDRP